MLLYIFSIILLFTLIILMPKIKGRINLIKTIILTFICLFAYNMAICYLYNLVKMPITLFSLAITNFLISIYLIYTIIKKKQVQKYKIIKKDIFATLFIVFIVALTIGINFRGIDRIRYISMDSVQHYKAAREFSEVDSLLSTSLNTTTSKSHMPMGYVNAGILFKIFEPLIGVVSLYKIYILFEAFIYFLTGMIFYFTIQKMLKNKNEWIIAIAFSIIYIIGYPLNSLISGFHYLILGILYFSTIFYMIINKDILKKIEFKYQIILLLLLNLGLIFSYALFCPIIYLAELVYFIMNYKENKSKKQLIISLICVLLITGFMGCEFILLQRAKEIGQTGIKLEGWIYQNNWSNFILFLPFAIYYTYQTRKDKNLFIEKAIFLIFIIFYLVLFIGKNIGICSSYYFYKTSYLLWFVLIYANINGMILFMRKDEIKKYIVNIFTIFYLFLLMICLFFIDTPLVVGENKKESISNVMEIFTFNKTNMNIDIPFVYKEELELFEELDKVLKNGLQNNKSNILMVGNTTQEKWLQALTGYYHTIYTNMQEDINKWNNGKYEYLIILQKRELYEIIKPAIDMKNAEIIYQNEGGILYKRNGE